MAHRIKGKVLLFGCGVSPKRSCVRGLLFSAGIEVVGPLRGGV
jgi:hypothetical protein